MPLNTRWSRIVFFGLGLITVCLVSALVLHSLVCLGRGLNMFWFHLLTNQSMYKTKLGERMEGERAISFGDTNIYQIPRG